MDSKTYIKACALFMFDHGKYTKEATLVISELHPEDDINERTSEKAARLSWTSRARDAFKSLIDNLLDYDRELQAGDRQIGDRVGMLPAHYNQRIT